METITIDTTQYTEEEQNSFIEGWNNAGGYTEDAEAGVDSPWCCPWYCGNGIITVPASATTPESAGAAYWKICEPEVERLLEEEAE